jgi:hypothetical protein
MRDVELFCLSCGKDLPEPLRRAASLRCHDCREAGEPIFFELALRARELTRARATHDIRRGLRAEVPAA